jgi:hypothetical protein
MPPTATKKVLIVNDKIFTRNVLIPIASAKSSFSRTAIMDFPRNDLTMR